MRPATVRERALRFACEGEQLVGVLSLPAEPASDLALLVVVGGPQVRCGSHRQFTQLCRAAAAAGTTALRFDVRGMGDSTGALHHFEQISSDIGAAIEALLGSAPQLRRVVLWGLCDGASASLLYLHATADPRVAGLVLLNPWVRSAETLARAHVKHYYWQRLRQPSFWKKLLSGGVAGQALRDLAANLGKAFGLGSGTASGAPAAQAASPLPFQQRMLLAARSFGGPVQMVLSGQDYTAKEFIELAGRDDGWRSWLARPAVQRLDLAEADHTFSDPAAAQALSDATVQWLQATARP